MLMGKKTRAPENEHNRDCCGRCCFLHSAYVLVANSLDMIFHAARTCLLTTGRRFLLGFFGLLWSYRKAIDRLLIGSSIQRVGQPGEASSLLGAIISFLFGRVVGSMNEKSA